MTHPGCRISRVRPKGRGLAEVVYLKPRHDLIRETLLAWARTLAESAPAASGLAGFAFVVWNRERESSVSVQSWEAGIGLVEAPDFVRGILVNEIARKAAEKAIHRFHDIPPPDESA